MNDGSGSVSLEDGALFELKNGLWIGKKPPFSTARVIRNTNFLDSGEIHFASVPTLEVEERQLATRALRPGDIIVERSGGGPKQPVGRVVFFDRDDSTYSFSNFTSVVRVKDKARLDPRFVFYILLNLYRTGGTEDLQRRTTGIRNLNFQAYKKRAAIPLSSPNTQAAAIRLLDTAREAINQHHRLAVLAEELRQSLARVLLLQGLTSQPARETEIGMLPASWELVPLETLITEGPQNGLYKHSSAYGDGVRILRINDFSNTGDVVSAAEKRVAVAPDELATYSLREGDIVLNRVNSLSHLGKTALVGHLDEPMVFESNMMRFRVHADRALAGYVFRVLNMAICKRQILGHAKRAVAQASINQGGVKAILVPLPEVSEQQKMIEILEQCERKAQMHRHVARSLEELFNTLLEQVAERPERLGAIEAAP